jgi:hypothetical protein
MPSFKLWILSALALFAIVVPTLAEDNWFRPKPGDSNWFRSKPADSNWFRRNSAQPQTKAAKPNVPTFTVPQPNYRYYNHAGTRRVYGYEYRPTRRYYFDNWGRLRWVWVWMPYRYLR